MAGYRPKVTLSAAVSIDGKIASVCGDSKFSSPDDKKRIHRLRAAHDAIIIGKVTAISDDPLLTTRFAGGKNPMRVIIDSRAMLPLSLRMIKTAHKVPTVIAASSKITESRRAKLQSCGVSVITAGNKTVNVSVLLQKLWRMGIRSVMLEGGGRTNWEFVRKKLVDEIIVTVAPFMLGGKTAPTLVDGTGLGRIGSSKFCLKGAKRSGNEVVLRYSKLQVI